MWQNSLWSSACLSSCSVFLDQCKPSIVYMDSRWCQVSVYCETKSLQVEGRVCMMLFVSIGSVCKAATVGQWYHQQGVDINKQSDGHVSPVCLQTQLPGTG
jgi:hypothetical protein